jgi:L-ascorbate metabolism protein UlaG (beta-lactamase superfamily)
MTAQLDWYGCATFRLTLGSLVLFLDAYIDRVPGAAGSGLRADDIERADWIVVGHSHEMCNEVVARSKPLSSQAQRDAIGDPDTTQVQP